MISIGPYDVESVLGEGGMGVVFRARHRENGRAVALKVVKARGSADTNASMLHELRAAARLTHPNVVAILDVGTVLRAVELHGYAIPEGSVYLVMELVEGGALTAIPRSWEQTRDILLHVLEGLGHAHARGVIHRDLKPANILLERLPSEEVHPKISDFGLAHMDPEAVVADSTEFRGTPAYVAPEQVVGQLRDQGPWTDLYAIGCLAFELVAGHPPYSGANYLAVLQQQLSAPPPALPESAVVPAGFESWLARSMAKRPGQRYRHAADAAYGLMQLGEVEGDVLALDPTEVGVAATILSPTWAWPAGPAPQPLQTRDGPTRSAVIAPPFAPTWREESGRGLLRTTGVALFGERPAPLVEREDEKQRLWRCLEVVHETGAPRCVVLDGPRGSGRTTLAGWLAERADELGLAVVVRAEHGREDAHFHGIAGMLRRYFRLGGLDAERARERVHSWLDDIGATDAAAHTGRLVDWIAGEGPGVVSDELLDIGHSLIELASQSRPVLLVLDDAHWGANSLIFAHQLLVRGDLPVLIVCVVGPPEEATENGTAPVLAAITAHQNTVGLTLSPHSARAQVELLTHYYGLHYEAAAALVEHADGDLALTLLLLRDAIARSDLTPVRDGWTLATSELSVPSDLVELSLVQAEEIVRELDQPERRFRTLELAAVLGRRFDERTWRRACSRAGLVGSNATLEAMLRHDLLRRDDDLWSFSTPAFSDGLVARASRAGRFEMWNGVCAEAVGTEPADPARLAQYARHLALANRPDTALQALLDASRQALAIGDGRGAYRALHRFSEVAASVELSVDDPRVIEALALYGATAVLRFDLLGGLDALLAEALHAAQRLGDAGLSAYLRASLSYWELCVGTMDRAVRFAEEAALGLAEIDHAYDQLVVLTKVGPVLTCAGRAGDAAELFEAWFERGIGHPDVRGFFAGVAAEALTYGGQTDAMRRWLGRLEPHRSARDHATGLLVRVHLADVTDDHDAMERDAGELLESSSYMHRNRRFIVTCLRTLSRVRHQPDAVEFDELETLAGMLAPTFFEHARVRLAMCHLAILRGDEAVEQYFELARPGLGTGKIVFALARDAEAAALTALACGHPIATRLAYVAREQWRGLGDQERAAALEPPTTD